MVDIIMLALVGDVCHVGILPDFSFVCRCLPFFIVLKLDIAPFSVSFQKQQVYIFEEEHISIMVINVQHIKGVPRRKERLVDLVRHGLEKAGFVSNWGQGEFREITRYR